ncbi:MAG: amino acid ABC transporter permease [Actinomycetaceae bacterium]|nr:amino acid ABC transporter permease [Actinomycetaceae bacterium]
MSQNVEPADGAPEVIKAVPVRHWGRWISALIVAFIAYGIINQLITNEKFQWDVVFENLFKPQILTAITWTIYLTIGAMVLGIIMAVTMAIMRRSENPVLRGVSTAYIWFFRGTPIYTQLIFWGLIGTLFPTITVGIPWTGIDFFTFNPTGLFADRQHTMFVYAVLGLGLNEGAYLSEIVRSGLNSVDPGQEEAAKALGMNKSQIMRRIIIPQAMRVIVPPTGNETISMLKTTSLVTAVPLSLELTYVTNAMGFSSFRPVPFLIVAALWYLTITSILMVGQYYLERYYGKGAASENNPARNARKHRKSHHSRQEAINAAGTAKQDPFLEFTP